MTPSERADRAQEMLDSAIFKQALQDIRMKFVVQLEGVPLSDVETQHEITLMLQLLKRIPAELQHYVNDAKMRQATEKERTFIERIRERYG